MTHTIIIFLLPNVRRPVLPNVRRPVLLNGRRPVLPNGRRPVLPNVRRPVLPNGRRPVLPNGRRPVVPILEFRVPPAAAPAHTFTIPEVLFLPFAILLSHTLSPFMFPSLFLSPLCVSLSLSLPTVCISLSFSPHCA